MVTTVTITTATVVTTAAVASLALIAVLTLLALLIQKEIFSGLKGSGANHLSQALNIAIVPLIIVFITSMVLKVFEVLH